MDKLRAEYFILFKLYYKNKNQHKKSKHFNHLCQVIRVLKKLLFDPSKAGDKLKPNETNLPKTNVALLQFLVASTEQSYISFRQVAAQTYFMASSIMFMGLLSTIHSEALKMISAAVDPLTQPTAVTAVPKENVESLKRKMEVNQTSSLDDDYLGVCVDEKVTAVADNSTTLSDAFFTSTASSVITTEMEVKNSVGSSLSVKLSKTKLKKAKKAKTASKASEIDDIFGSF
jgi:hypothetical protein